MVRVPGLNGKHEVKETKPPAGSKAKAEQLVAEIERLVEAEVFDRERLQKVADRYQGLGREERNQLFAILMDRMEVRPDDIIPPAQRGLAGQGRPRGLAAGPDGPAAGPGIAVADALQAFLPCSPGGLRFLLDFRSDLLTARRQVSGDFEALDRDLEQLFDSWFQEGFLFLNEITLDSPYRQIELIKNGDMVHPMTTLEEMGRRLGRDRRCFALYHRVMPDRPVVFIEVALTRGLVHSIHDIISGKGDAESGRRDTAVFYSINNTQNGLAGLGLGKVLIFQVVEFLKRESPEIKNFCTLRPFARVLAGVICGPCWKGAARPLSCAGRILPSISTKRCATF